MPMVIIGLYNNSVKIVLQHGDVDLLKKINNIINSSNPLKFCRGQENRKDGYKCQDCYGLYINSKHICLKLIELGCPPKKSLILQFPTTEQVPQHLLWHFIRRTF